MVIRDQGKEAKRFIVPPKTNLSRQNTLTLVLINLPQAFSVGRRAKSRRKWQSMEGRIRMTRIPKDKKHGADDGCSRPDANCWHRRPQVGTLYTCANTARAWTQGHEVRRRESPRVREWSSTEIGKDTE